MQLLGATQFKGAWSFKERGSEFQKGSQPKNVLIERQTRTRTMTIKKLASRRAIQHCC